MSLIKHPALAGKIVHAWQENCKRDMREHGDESTEKIEETRFRFNIDENDRILGVVTDKYRLVTNAQMISALDMAAEERGLTLEPIANGTGYNGGRSKYSFSVPSLSYGVAKDPSKVAPVIVLKNDYRGGGGLSISSGFYRLICTNGLVRLVIDNHDYRRHVGDFNLMTFVGRTLDKVRDQFEIDRLLAEKYVATPVVAGQELVERMEKDTPERYHAALDRAVRENAVTIGENVWAYVQAVAEVATHRMQERANFNLSADTWAARMERVIREHAEIK